LPRLPGRIVKEEKPKQNSTPKKFVDAPPGKAEPQHDPEYFQAFKLVCPRQGSDMAQEMTVDLHRPLSFASNYCAHGVKMQPCRHGIHRGYVILTMPVFHPKRKEINKDFEKSLEELFSAAKKAGLEPVGTIHLVEPNPTCKEPIERAADEDTDGSVQEAAIEAPKGKGRVAGGKGTPSDTAKKGGVRPGEKLRGGKPADNRPNKQAVSRFAALRAKK
jgi:hypothetical protein